MTITILRTKSWTHAIEGTLSIDGKRVCDTAECPLTAIPAGDYEIRLQYITPYQKRMMVLYPKWVSAEGAEPGSLPVYDPAAGSWRFEVPLWPFPSDYEAGINSVMPLVVPMLKPGNGVVGRTDGSIIVGERFSAGALMHPLRIYSPLRDRIRKALSRKRPITLTIA